MAKRSSKKSRLSAMQTWQVVAAGLFVLIAGVGIWGVSNAKGSSTDVQQLAEDMVEFVNLHLLQGQTASLEGVGEVHGVVQLNLSIGGKSYTSYATKDGSLFFVSGISVDAMQRETPAPSPKPDVPKSDRPVVELFVISHCPFGTQMEKGLLPVLELLGERIDFQLKFVNYAMHGEKEVIEQTYQYCIQKEFPDKLEPYLHCFLDKADREGCLDKVGIDRSALEECYRATDEQYNITGLFADRSTWSGGRFPPYPIYDADNAKYGVRGSPTLVINGRQVSTARDPASLLATICAAFNSPPEECSTQLSSATPSPGFGFSTTASGSTASCG